MVFQDPFPNFLRFIQISTHFTHLVCDRPPKAFRLDLVLSVIAVQNFKDMKRCCLFFLAFITAISLAVLTGSFEGRLDTMNPEIDSADVTMSSGEKKELQEPEHFEIRETYIDNKRTP